MTGYRTIPTKDTFDVDERLGGFVTIKQLAYIVVVAFVVIGSGMLSNEIFQGKPELVYAPIALGFIGFMFIFGNLDKWVALRVNYYIMSNSQILEKHPELLRNIRCVEEDKIVTLDGRIIGIIKVTPINFPLLSDEAKEGKISAYEMYLRQLVYPIMHLVQSEHVDIEEYLSQVVRKQEAAGAGGVKGMDEYVRAHIRFIRDYLRNNKARSKHHYVVLQVQDPRASGGRLAQDALNGILIRMQSFLVEFRADSLLAGGQAFQKPAHYVMLDLPGKKMIFRTPGLMPLSAPSRCYKIGNILQFESKVAMLRFARSKEGAYYYGPIDLKYLLQKEFRDMPLHEREQEFSLDERRRHVLLSAGKTRWAYDEVEKHIAVLAEKLEATGLRVHRVRGEELYTGRHASMAEAAKVKVTPHHLVVDSIFMKVVYATGYPYQVNLGWLANIVDGREDYDVTMYIYPATIQDVLSTFRGAILKLSTEKKARADFLDPETEQHLEDVKNFFTQIVSGKEKYFLASLYITCKAPSKKNLDTVIEKCKSDLAGASIDYQMADYNMAEAVATTRLTGRDRLNKRREFPSSSLAATFPHISSSIDINPQGIFFGFDWMATPIVVDLTELPNQHISILGESGSGKSYFAKSLIPRYLLSGYRVFVTDPDGEYVEIAKRFGGQVTSVGPKFETSINPLDLDGREPQDKIRSLLGLFSIICGGQLTKYQESLLSDVLEGLFEKAAKKKIQMTMSDLHYEIARRAKTNREEQTRHDLQFLLMSMRPFCKGGLYAFIDRRTRVTLGQKMHVFDLREYQQDKVLKDFFNYMIFDYITHHLQKDKSLKALFMDEGWTMVNYPGSENYVRYIIKDSRKYNVSFVFITQELEDMLSSPAGKSILNNTATQFLFHQKEAAMPLLRTTLNLTHDEYERLIACGKGEGLMISDRNRLMFRVRTDMAEHALITSDPNEAANAEREAGAVPQAGDVKAGAAGADNELDSAIRQHQEMIAMRQEGKMNPRQGGQPQEGSAEEGKDAEGGKAPAKRKMRGRASKKAAAKGKARKAQRKTVRGKKRR